MQVLTHFSLHLTQSLLTTQTSSTGCCNQATPSSLRSAPCEYCLIIPLLHHPALLQTLRVHHIPNSLTLFVASPSLQNAPALRHQGQNQQHFLNTIILPYALTEPHPLLFNTTAVFSKTMSLLPVRPNGQVYQMPPTAHFIQRFACNPLPHRPPVRKNHIHTKASLVVPLQATVLTTIHSTTVRHGQNLPRRGEVHKEPLGSPVSTFLTHEVGYTFQT